MDFLTDPWTWWVEPFIGNEANQYALAAVLLTAVCTSVVGTWVVLRGMSFLGDALAHGVLPGLAIAFVVGADPTIGAFVAAIAMVAGIGPGRPMVCHGFTPARSIPARTISAVAAGSVISSGTDLTSTPSISAWSPSCTSQPSRTPTPERAP